MTGVGVRVWLLLFSMTMIVGESRADDQRAPLVEWSTTNIQYMYGFNWNVGKDVVDTFTIEHTDSWHYGDNYFFMDVLNVVEQERHSRFNYYLEYHPRFSLNKMFGLNLAAGPIKEVLIANEFDFADGFFSHSTGIGFSLDLPRFTYANANFMVRDNVDADSDVAFRSGLGNAVHVLRVTLEL